MNVVKKISENGYCIGCGICVSVCPNNSLDIGFNSYGEYEVFSTDECIDNCKRCLDICPFFKNKQALKFENIFSVDSMQYDKNLGYFYNTYYGFVKNNNKRKKSASGGLTTWLLKRLLRNNYVDFAIMVTRSNNPDKLFKYEVIKSEELIQKSSGSAYYPVELSGVLDFIKSNEKKFAVVGLPCFIRGLRFLKKESPIYENRIKFLIGLTCGQLKSKFFTDYLKRKSSIKSNIKEIKFRKYNKNDGADNFIVKINFKNNEEASFEFKNDVKNLWVNRHFMPVACRYCEDVFAENADVTFMDAWLSEFIKEPLGTNLVVTRNLKINKILQNGITDGEIIIESIKGENVVKSQKGVIEYKKRKNIFNFNKAKKEKEYVPEIERKNNKISFIEKKEMHYLNILIDKSRELWRKVKKDKIDFERYNSEIKKIEKKLNIIKKYKLFIHRIKKIFFKLIKILRKDKH